ncbi:carboxypeptidase regulatory-like domain-containing protein [Comamonas sp. MYb69]|uniref:carboxypeptidase regulatory-like domain-containing protein n=1 Tax=Comamonas sp. MYb69 TaxID=1848650 RepID=UPI0030A1B648
MKNHTPTLSAAMLCAALLSATAAHAQHPALQKAGDVQYVCGGIGIDESTAMRAAMKDYPLSLLFATRSGDYLAKIQVVIADGKGQEVAQFQAQGPVCLLRLDSGRYTVKANAEGGKTIDQSVEVAPAGTPGKTLDYRF